LQAQDHPQIGLGVKTCVSHYDHALTPSGRLEAAQHLTKEDVLTPFAFGIKRFTSDGRS